MRPRGGSGGLGGAGERGGRLRHVHRPHPLPTQPHALHLRGDAARPLQPAGRRRRRRSGKGEENEGFRFCSFRDASRG